MSFLDNRIASTRLLREMTGRGHALLAGRGAAGIWAALRALDLRHQYVLLPANTCYIVLWAVLRSGNKPLLLDVDSESSVLSRGVQLNTLLDRKIGAIIPCHMYGLPAPMTDICAWAKANDIYVIE